MCVISITRDEKRILLHSLGLDFPVGNTRPYRNYFVTCEGHSDQPLINRLVGNGLMFHSGREYLYHVTEAGREMAGRDPLIEESTCETR
jgi:hypothetical protein